MTIQVKVIPRSPQTKLAGTMADGTLKIHIAAPPEKGKANAELLRFLARQFHVTEESIKILNGNTSTRKLIQLPD